MQVLQLNARVVTFDFGIQRNRCIARWLILLKLRAGRIESLLSVGCVLVYTYQLLKQLNFNAQQQDAELRGEKLAGQSGHDAVADLDTCGDFS